MSADVEYGLVVGDDNGSLPEGVSVALRSEDVSLVATSADYDETLVILRPRDCRRLGEWLMAAADRLEPEKLAPLAVHPASRQTSITTEDS